MILSTFAQKMLNCGHSINGTKLVLFHGAVKFLDILRKSELHADDKGHQPLHFEKGYKRLERRLQKIWPGLVGMTAM